MAGVGGTWNETEVVVGREAERRTTTGHPWKTLRAYVELTKPKSVSFLVFTAFAGMVLASASEHISLTPFSLAVGLLAIVSGCAGCNAMTCYIDRDVDALMERTRHRPLPEGRIAPANHAIVFATVLLAASLGLAWVGGAAAAAFMALGIVDNVVVYSLWLKRSSAWNIVLGSVSGGMPVAFGWAFISGSLGPAAVLAAALVVLWTPTHIWSLALRYREDYARAKIPMLPVVTRETTALRCMVSTAALLVPVSLALPLASPVLGTGYTAVAAGFGVPVVAVNLWLWLRPSRERAWFAFKLSSPYLAIVFLALVLDAVF